ncbi:cupin domain-containing protein [Mangrovimonas aestuarii]|uniref:cupin domain-containing protein n=1 Tax=Mangrovimonas aestuarii TaxID=3018443 RepID=UPI0023793120|nr:cupin domain-containing protein [Mangrovimonas aestuarii]
MKVSKHLSGLLSTLFLLTFLMPLSMYSQSNGENSVAMSSSDMNLKWGPCPEFMPNGCSIAVLHGDPAKRNVDILFKVPANSNIPNHWHNSAERIVLISGTMEVTYEGETTQTLNAGSYAYGPAKKQHTAKCLDNGPCVLFIAFEEPLDAFAIEKK